MTTYHNTLTPKPIGGGNFRSLTSEKHNTVKGSCAHTMRMAALVAFLGIASTLMAHSAVEPASAEPQDTAKVYVCTGSAAYAYHTHRDCRGLNRCTATIRQITVKEAKKQGRKFCGYCRRSIAIRKDGAKVTKSNEVI